MQPKNFGDYLLGNPLSQTSLGDITRALPLDGPPQIHLLQIIPKDLAAAPEVKALLLRNAKQWAPVKDLHALNLSAFGEKEETLFFACEYQQGRLLSDILSHCLLEGLPLSADQAVYLAERIAGALMSVCASGMAYGCLSPERVLVTFEGEVKLLPGVFRDLHTTPAAAVPALATYRRYLPPALAPSKSAKPSADRYALGALMFELLCREPFRPGDAPFDPAARLAEVQTERGGTDPLPEALHAILRKSCLLDAPDAYRDLADVKADLDQLITSGEYSPTTFNIAFLMHTLFRGEDEADAKADQEFEALDREAFRPSAPPPPPTPPQVSSPPPAPIPIRQAPPAVEEATFGMEPEASKKGLYIGIGVAAAVILVAVLSYLAFFKPKGPSQAETAAQEQVAKLQKEQQAMAAKLKALEDEKAQLASQVTNAKTADEKAKAQKALEEAQKKLQAQKEEQRLLAATSSAAPPTPPATSSAKPSVPEAKLTQAPAVPPPASPQPATAPPAATGPSAAPPASQTPPEPAPAQAAVKPGDFVELWGVDVKPKQLNELRVDMPSAARQNRVAGTLYMEVQIDETGKVTAAKVVKGLPFDFGVDRACQEAAMKLRYSPAFKAGVPVSTKMTFPIQVR